MVFELKIWFRFNSGNEKDFEHYSVEALNVHEAFNLIKKAKFPTNKNMPISYERIINGVSDGNVYKPSHSEINDSNFSKRVSEIKKEYKPIVPEIKDSHFEKPLSETEKEY